MSESHFHTYQFEHSGGVVIGTDDIEAARASMQQLIKQT